jgi:hypothetical protein
VNNEAALAVPPHLCQGCKAAGNDSLAEGHSRGITPPRVMRRPPAAGMPLCSLSPELDALEGARMQLGSHHLQEACASVSSSLFEPSREQARDLRYDKEPVCISGTVICVSLLMTDM